MRNLLENFDQEKEVLLVTHDGVCHADDVLTTALLQLYFKEKSILTKVIRTRDPNFKIPENAIVYDVFLGRFDHHQGDIHESGRALSSIGRIWRWGKKEFRNVFKIDEESWKNIDENLIRPIDISDTTGELNPLSYAMIGVRGGERTEEAAWKSSLEFMTTTIKYILNEERVQTGFRTSLKNAPTMEFNNRVIKLLDRNFPVHMDYFYYDADGFVVRTNSDTYILRMFNKTPLRIDKDKLSEKIPGVIKLNKSFVEIQNLSVLESIL